ncbi:MAG: Na/Pi cotransporter family protein [Deltaproteobacteria bacterium]|nr:MAG: Na/Pi cotransporter family protein [Deltaproteobacteria bacterium]
MDAWVTIGTFAGGIGLFLLGMHLLTEGLKAAAGGALKGILARATGTRLRALASGALITGIVQSSSAVTIAAIGFVNAGLLDLGQAVWVVFGSNVGTTMTGWLVALSGLEVDLAVVALPAIGVGTLMSTFAKKRRAGPIGDAIAGFGLFFLGLGFMKDAFSDLASSVDPSTFDIGGVSGVALFAGVGLVLTAATQSSSASLAIALAAAQSRLIPIEAAGAWVIGANLGTTSTALISVIGATPNARRTAMAHVAFNLVAAGAAFLLLPFAFDALDAALEALDFTASPASSLALFHTVFNVLGVLLMWPLTGRLTRFLARHFVEEEEEEGRTEPKHLDANVLAVPAVALEALRLEGQRVLSYVAEAVIAACAPGEPSGNDVQTNTRAATELTEAIADFSSQLDRVSVSAKVAEGLARVVQAIHHVNVAVEQAEQISAIRQRPGADEEGSQVVPEMLAEVRHIARTAAAPSPNLASLEDLMKELTQSYRVASTAYTSTAAEGVRATAQALYRQQVASEARRAAKHLVHAARELSEP